VSQLSTLNDALVCVNDGSLTLVTPTRASSLTFGVLSKVVFEMPPDAVSVDDVEERQPVRVAACVDVITSASAVACTTKRVASPPVTEQLQWFLSFRDDAMHPIACFESAQDLVTEFSLALPAKGTVRCVALRTTSLGSQKVVLCALTGW
jgi:hypothetical protein